MRPYRDHSREIAGIHAGYLIATGLWSLLHRPSFEAVTGRKTDYWLVRTVGGLALACGAALGASVISGRRSPEIQLLAGAQALVFMVADVHAAAAQSPVYAGDIAVQAALSPSWFLSWRGEATPG